MSGLAASLSTIATEIIAVGALFVLAGVTAAARGNTALSWVLLGIGGYGNAAGNLAYAASDAIKGDWTDAAFSVALAIFILWFWWWLRRRRKDRAPLAIGAKTKAARDALVRKAREAAKPRPVLRPAPGGAR